MTHNVIVNGDFETGNTTGWTVSDVTGDAAVYVKADALRSGSYGLALDPGSTAGNGLTLSQQIPIFNVTTPLHIHFKFPDAAGGMYVSCKVVIDSTELHTINLDSAPNWVDLDLDVSAFNGGIHTLKFVVWRHT